MLRQILWGEGEDIFGDTEAVKILFRWLNFALKSLIELLSTRSILNRTTEVWIKLSAEFLCGTSISLNSKKIKFLDKGNHRNVEEISIVPQLKQTFSSNLVESITSFDQNIFDQTLTWSSFDSRGDGNIGVTK